MSKNLICPEAELNNILQKVSALIRNKKNVRGRINFDYDLPDLSNKAKLYFTTLAWLKMVSLVSSFNKEVQWHGTVEQINENTWKVNDILTFPHEATGATVTSKQEEYEEWINTLDDNTFNQLRFHGHSHVEMGVTPSDVDMKYREKVIQNISPNDTSSYYIFLILNKRNEITIEIYDIAKNIVYKNLKDIEVVVETEDGTLADFVKGAKEKVSAPPTITTVNTFKPNKKNKKITTNEERIVKSDFYNRSYEIDEDYCSTCRDFDCMNCRKY